MTTYDCVVIGAGAAGIGAARRLAEAACDFLVIEARGRVGGRAWTVEAAPALPVDLGCGWLHSADRNPLTTLARAEGFSIDERLPDWSRGGAAASDWRRAYHALEDRIAAWAGTDIPAAALLEPAGRWNAAIDAISTYVSGAELAEVSVRDLQRYHDSGINWRVREGLGAAIAALARGLPVAFETAATRLDRSGRTLRIETTRGALEARAAIVTLPTPLVGALVPEKQAAAAGLPLGLTDKLYFALDGADAFPADHHVLGASDRSATGSYQLRPHGRPIVEAFLGGRNARTLEAAGKAAMAAFAVDELAGRLGGAIRSRLTLLAASAWAADPWSRGAYSYARPGEAEARAALAAPLEDRLFFAGEATSAHGFSTAHGAFLSGVDAAERVLAGSRPEAAGGRGGD
jgi:monoamine oxidase